MNKRYNKHKITVTWEIDFAEGVYESIKKTYENQGKSIDDWFEHRCDGVEIDMHSNSMKVSVEKIT